jgi:hypothetical protein
MTTILVGLQDSLLVARSSKAGWKVNESLMGTHPESIAFDPINPGTALAGAYGKQPMADKIGTKLVTVLSLVQM